MPHPADSFADGLLLPLVYRVAQLGAHRFPRNYSLPEERVAIYAEAAWQRPRAGETQPVLGWADLFFESPSSAPDVPALTKQRWGHRPIVAHVWWEGPNGLLWTPASWLAPMLNVDGQGRIDGWICLLLTANPRHED